MTIARLTITRMTIARLTIARMTIARMTIPGLDGLVCFVCLGVHRSISKATTTFYLVIFISIYNIEKLSMRQL
jgi:hypothetical protein